MTNATHSATAREMMSPAMLHHRVGAVVQLSSDDADTLAGEQMVKHKRSGQVAAVATMNSTSSAAMWRGRWSIHRESDDRVLNLLNPVDHSPGPFSMFSTVCIGLAITGTLISSARRAQAEIRALYSPR